MPIGKSSIARAAKANEKATAPTEKKKLTAKGEKESTTAEAAVNETRTKKAAPARSGKAKSQSSAAGAPAVVGTGVISALSPEVMEKVIEKKHAAPENDSRVSLGEDMPYFLL